MAVLDLLNSKLQAEVGGGKEMGGGWREEDGRWVGGGREMGSGWREAVGHIFLSCK